MKTARIFQVNIVFFTLICFAKIVISQQATINEMIVKIEPEAYSQYDSQYALVKIKSRIPDVDFFYWIGPYKYEKIDQRKEKIGNIYMEIEQGTHDIEIKAKEQEQIRFNNYLIKNFEFRGGWVYNLYISIKPPDGYGILLIESEPKEVKVIIEYRENKDSLKTPFTYILPIGQVDVKFIHPNYSCMIAEKQLVINDFNTIGWTYVHHAFAIPKPFVSIIVLPPKASEDAIIYLNEDKIGNAPFHGKLKAGKYKINIEKQKYTLISPLEIEVDPCKELNYFELSMEKWGELIIDLEDCNSKVSEILLNEQKIGRPKLRKQLPPNSTNVIKLFDEKNEPFGKIKTIQVPSNKEIKLTKANFEIECINTTWFKRNKNKIIGGSIFTILLSYTSYKIFFNKNSYQKLPTVPDIPWH